MKQVLRFAQVSRFLQQITNRKPFIIFFFLSQAEIFRRRRDCFIHDWYVHASVIEALLVLAG